MPHLRRAALLLLLAIFVALPATVLTGCGSTTGSSDRAPAQAPLGGEQGTGSAGEAAQPTKPVRPGKSARIPVITGTVTEVIDGHTVCVRLVGGRTEKVRFTGVDTPESTTQVEPYGKEAAAYTRRRLSGRRVYFELDVGEPEQYGRLLPYVWLEPPRDTSETKVRAKMFNAELLLLGMV